MSNKKTALIDPKLLALSDWFVRRAARDGKIRFKRGKRVEAMAHIYNMLLLGLFDDYEGFLRLSVQSVRERLKP